MKKSSILLLTVIMASLVSGCIIVPAERPVRPAQIVERRGPAPYRTAVWVPGEWVWRRHHWVWVRGYWR